MASVINTNTLSMVTQQNLNQSQNALNTSMERLSSGMRINSAKDDAAGQAIANRMDSQITGLSQAQRNANDGISVAQTAEGALNQVNDNLQRVRELTVQAQNGTNNADDLSSIQDEITMRLDEINRISEQTSFNGIDILQEDNTLSIQVGANDGETISIDLKEINTSTLSLANFNVNGTGISNEAADSQGLKLNGFTEGATSGEFTNASFNTATTVDEMLANVKDGGTITTTNAAGTTDTTKYTYNEDSNSFSFDRAAVDVTDASQAATDLGLTPDAGETNTVTVKLGDVETQVNISSSGTLTSAETGENLYLTGTDGTKNLSVTNAGGSQATIDDLVTEIAAIDGSSSNGSITTTDGTTYENSATSVADTIVTRNETIGFDDLKQNIKDDTTNAYKVELDGNDTDTTSDQYIIKDDNASISGYDSAAVTTNAAVFTSGFEGDNTIKTTASATVYANEDGEITDGLGNEIFSKEDGSLTFESTSDATATENPLEALDAALKQVDSMRSDLGAVQNRFDSAITNLATTETNLASAQSRIQDADYAEEVSSMTTAQILQQAGTSMLTQANQVPQSVLSLLG